MKYDLSKKPTKFAERTLSEFSNTLISMLTKEALESITVNSICDAANYPRATFYNYFDDIYDLLNYCWLRLTQDIRLGDYTEMHESERTAILFDRLYDYLSAHETEIRKIIRRNSIDGRLVESLRRYMREQIYQIIVNSPCSDKYEVPKELIAEHYSNTIGLLLEWCFLREKPLSKEEAETTLTYLLEGI